MAYFTSTVADVIDFKPSTENHKWRAEGGPSVECMIKQIDSYQREWRESLREGTFTDVTVSENVEKFLHKFIFHCNVETGHGCGTLEETKNCLDKDNENQTRSNRSKEEQETSNLVNAYKHLLSIKKDESDEEFHGFIEESMLRETNKIILKGVNLKEETTKPGVYSNKRRITEFNGELYEYPHPVDMQLDVTKLLDKFNSLYQDAQSESDDEKKVEKLFKTCSWFLFEMLDLHPFGDGNGRLCRLLCNYVLSTCTPFPSPIYNVFSKSSKDDYQQALVDARKSKDRHPCSLTTMIIECNFYAWEKFVEEIRKDTGSMVAHRN